MFLDYHYDEGDILFLGETFLLMVVTYAVSLFFGSLMEKYLRMPWIFASLFFGLVLSWLGVFRPTIESDSFQELATFGMYTLLFMIGFNFELKKMGELKKHIILGTVVIISLEGLFGSLLLYFAFPAEVNHSYLIGLITALSFATVGEAVLLPILAEFKVVKTTFGQLTLGIGTLDDVLEVLMLGIVAILPMFLGIAQTHNINPLLIGLSTSLLAFLTLLLIKCNNKIKSILSNHASAPYISSLIALLVFFSFIVIGGYAFEGTATIGAILAGIVVRGLLPKERLYENERAIEFLGYVFLSPLFFLSIGADFSVTSIAVYPILIVSI